MKKSLFTALSLAAAISLNAAVLATVDGDEITDEDLLPALGSHASEMNKISPDMKKRLVEGLVDRKLMLHEAVKSGIEKDNEYQKALQDVKDNVAINMWMKKQFDAIKVDESKAKDFYEKNKSNFVVPAQVRAKHILVESAKEANDIIKQLSGLKGDELSSKFSEIAKNKSIDQGSRSAGGELGWFGKSQMVAPFADAAFALKNGEISKKPVQSQFGYHIILKEDAKAQNTVSYDKVRENIVNRLKSEEFKKQMDAKVDTLKKNAKIEYK